MIGAIVGDVIGSRWEKHTAKSGFALFGLKNCFTDDTVHTVAVAKSILYGKSYSETLRDYYSKYPYAGYGKGFKAWASTSASLPYNSYGNGSAMRVSPIAYAFHDKQTVLIEAEKSAEVTHTHPEGIKGAKAIALAVFMARNSATKDEIIKGVTEEFGYDMNIIPQGFQISCQGTIPQALHAFYESTDFEDSIRKAILLNGDSDTIACITGSIAAPYYGYGKGLSGISKEILIHTFERLPDDLAGISVQFINRYIDSKFVRPAKMNTEAEFYDLFRSIFKK